MRNRLLEIYERELGYLRQSGEEFGRKYPAVAGRLLLEPDRCADPHVERLLEAFSFLSARIHLRLDDDLPELTEGFLDILYPHYLRPVPAMSVAQFHLDANHSSTAEPVTVAAGSELRTRRTVDDVACRFRTAYPVVLSPIEVVDCTWRRPEQIPSPVRVPDAVAVLRVVVRTRGDLQFDKLELKELCFYLAGEKGVTLPLYELLSRNLLDVLVRDTGRSLERDVARTTHSGPGAGGVKVVSLGRGALRPMGFEPDEALLPYTRRSFSGYRLLQEYFSLPEKFLFYTLTGLDRAVAAMQSQECELLFYVSSFELPERGQTLEQGVRPDTLRLGCTPIVNIFEQTAEPILVTHARHEYPVVPSARHGSGMEVYSIDEVTATNPSRRTATLLHALFEQRSHTVTSTSGGACWRSSRRLSAVDDQRPATTHLSIVDVDGVLAEPDAEVLTVRCICTNANLPARLSFEAEDGDLELASGMGVGRVMVLHRPTHTAPAPADSRQVWRLISQLSLNHLSLGEAGLPALIEILRLHNFTGAAQLDKQIAGLVSMKAGRHVAVMATDFGSVAARGMRLDLHLDESHFAGGSAYLFSAVLDRFFGLYVSMNSFSQLSVTSSLRKEVLSEWPPRAGNQVVM